MPNLYIRLPVLRARLNIETRIEDALLLEQAEIASRELDQRTGRQFFASIATRYIDGSGSRDLALDGDLLSLSAVATDSAGDGTFATSLVEGTDYLPMYSAEQYSAPVSTACYRLLRLTTYLGGDLAVWPVGPRMVRITGTWGYSATEETVITGLGAAVTVADNPLSAGASSLTVPDDRDALAVGDSLLIGTEEIFVSAIRGTTATVTRGVNGTTAAAHILGTAIRRRTYPWVAQQYVLERVSRRFRREQTGFAMLGGGDGGSSGYGVTSWRELEDLQRQLMVGHGIG